MPTSVPDAEWKLILAAHDGNLPLVTSLLSSGADPTFQLGPSADLSEYTTSTWQWNGLPALCVAAAAGHAPVVAYLLPYDARPEIRARALHTAALSGHAGTVEVLAAAGAPLVSTGDFQGTPTSALVGVAANLAEWTPDRMMTVRVLLKYGAGTEAVDQFAGLTALAHAVRLGRQELMEVLLDAGANVNARGVLDGAVRQGNVEMTKELLARTSSARETDSRKRLLSVAAENGQMDCIDLLLANGTQECGTAAVGATAFCLAAGKGQLGVIRMLLEKDFQIDAREEQRGMTPLMAAAEGKQLEAVKLLLDAGADLYAMDKAGGDTALHHACRWKGSAAKVDFQNKRWHNDWDKQIATIRLLLSKGISANVRNNRGQTALHLTISNMESATSHPAFETLPHDLSTARILCQDGRLEAAKTLLEAGADPNAADEAGIRPIHVAANALNVETILMLAGPGADVNAKDADNRTPLHHAVATSTLYTRVPLTGRPRGIMYPCFYTVTILVEHGADPMIRESHGRTALGELQESAKAKIRPGWHDEEEIARTVDFLIGRSSIT